MTPRPNALLPGTLCLRVSNTTPAADTVHLANRWQQPPRPIARQKPLNIGLFDDDARNQLDLFLHTDTL